MSTKFIELSGLIKNLSEAGVKEFSLGNLKVTFKDAPTTYREVLKEIPVDQSGGIEISNSLAEKIEQIRNEERELNKMINDPEEYEEDLARLGEHEFENLEDGDFNNG